MEAITSPQPLPDPTAVLLYTESFRLAWCSMIASMIWLPTVCTGLNAAIGGSPTSQHMLGQAADFHVAGLDLTTAWERIADYAEAQGYKEEVPACTPISTN